jgi:uncharacterized protein YecE (DUF72 family)
MRGIIYVGTSGWTYDAWKDGFYAGIPRSAWLKYYTQHFHAVEVNATFYHQLRQSTFAKWAETTPPDFRFAIKGHRYLTHVLKLEVSREVFLRQMQAVKPLGKQLAVMLWQLPAGLKCDPLRLERFARMLDTWQETRHALEFRHQSWFDEPTAECLRRHRLAACQSDAADWPLWDAVTTDLVYVRLHGHRITYESSYAARQLADWAKRIRRWSMEGRDVHIYFDNTDAGHAPRDAQRLVASLA